MGTPFRANFSLLTAPFPILQTSSILIFNLHIILNMLLLELLAFLFQKPLDFLDSSKIHHFLHLWSNPQVFPTQNKTRQEFTYLQNTSSSHNTKLIYLRFPRRPFRHPRLSGIFYTTDIKPACSIYHLTSKSLANFQIHIAGNFIKLPTVFSLDLAIKFKISQISSLLSCLELLGELGHSRGSEVDWFVWTTLPMWPLVLRKSDI